MINVGGEIELSYIIHLFSVCTILDCFNYFGSVFMQLVTIEKGKKEN